MRIIGIVGDGEVVKKHHIPAIKDLGWDFEVCTEKDDYNAFLNKKFDAISICTPNYLHIPQTIKALDKGHFVLVEKPLAISTKQAEELMSHPNVSKVAVCYQRRFGDRIEFEEIASIDAEILVRRDPEYWNTWRRDKTKSGGGALMNIFIHYLDLILSWTKGEVNIDFAKCAEREGIDQFCYVEMSIGKTKVKFVGSSLHSYRSTRMYIYGNKPKIISTYLEDKGKHKDVYKGLFEGKIISAQDAIKSLKLVEKIYDFNNNTNK